jgi:formylglycine-generating enzyme required for sulfatase activity
MKIVTFITLLGLLLTISGYSQHHHSKKRIVHKTHVVQKGKTKHKTLKAVSAATEEMQVSEILPNQMIQVVRNNMVLEGAGGVQDTFWMSNEITNKEYREFVDYLRAHPDDSLCVESSAGIVYERLDINFLSGQKKRTCFKHADILNNVIDTTVFEEENPTIANHFRHYFSDRKFDNYPVVGVSYINASLYCIWRNNMEKNKLSGNVVYRLPTQEEWSYVASFSRPEKIVLTKGVRGKKGKRSRRSVTKTVSYRSNSFLMPSISERDARGFSHFYGNVAEWVIPKSSLDPYNLKLIRGGSWKGTQSYKCWVVLNQNMQTDYIGFRIVQARQINQ